MELGDRVRVITADEELTGIFVPSTKKGVFVMKLDSGYNIGIEKNKIKSVKVIKRAEKRTAKAKAYKMNPKLPTVAVLSTGGTISSRVDYETGAVHSYLDANQLVRDMPEITSFANIICVPVLNKFSEELKPADWVTIARAAYKEIVKPHIAGVVITHGTDTMHYTSAALSFMLRTDKPVILTGSQRSSDRGSSDTRQNLLCAIIAATSKLHGVMLCMHASMSDDFCYLHRGTKVRKMHTSRRDAFQSINSEPVAEVWPDGRIEVLQAPGKPSKTAVDTKIEQMVALIQFYPGMKKELLMQYMKAKYKGIILAGTGLGHVSSDLIPVLKRMTKKGIFVGMTSQCINGRSHPHVYSTARHLVDAGVVYLDEMLAEVAYVKLVWALGHAKDIEEAKKIMLDDIAGEIGKRSEINQKIYK